MIPNEIVQKVIDTANIVEVISEFVSLKKAGVNYKGLCPFHNEKTPSFIVSPSKQIFKCFGCGEAGTAVSFLMKHENFTFNEAIRWLAKKYNIEIKDVELSKEQIEEERQKEALFHINIFAQKLFTYNLFNTDEGQIALMYLKNRGVNDESIVKFGLGWSMSDKEHLCKKALENGYNLELLEKAGLTNQIEQNNIKKGIDKFHSRVMFPIYSLSGQIIAFGGRIISNDVNAAKYINSPETFIYKKSQSLYGIYQAKNEIVKKNNCYLVEGYLDVISMHQKGITNTVASSGTSLTEEQIRIIRRFTDNITLVFDADQAGQKATSRGIELALKEGLNVKIVSLPTDEDPDSFCQKYSEHDIKEYFRDNEQDFVYFLIKNKPQNFDNNPAEKSKYLHQILNILSVINDKLKRDEYIKIISETFKINPNTIYIELHNIEKSKRNIQQNNTTQKDDDTLTIELPQISNELYVVEKQIIYYLLKFGDFIFDENQNVKNYLISEIEIDEGLKNPLFRKIFEIVKENIHQPTESIQKLLLNSPDDKIRELVNELFSETYQLSKIWEKSGIKLFKPEDTYKEDVRKLIITYKILIINETLKLINNSLNNPQIPDEEKVKQIELSQNLIKIRNEMIKQGGLRNIF